MSNRPKGLAAKVPAGAVLTKPSSQSATVQPVNCWRAVWSAPLAYLHWPAATSPHQRAVVVPPRAAYSHSASLSSR